MAIETSSSQSEAVVSVQNLYQEEDKQAAMDKIEIMLIGNLNALAGVDFSVINEVVASLHD